MKDLSEIYDDFSLDDHEIDFSLDKYIKSFAFEEPKDLNNYVSGGAKEYIKLGALRQNNKKKK